MWFQPILIPRRTKVDCILMIGMPNFKRFRTFPPCTFSQLEYHSSKISMAKEINFITIKGYFLISVKSFPKVTLAQAVVISADIMDTGVSILKVVINSESKLII